MIGTLIPFTIPLTLACPYCGKQATRSGFNLYTGVVFYAHHPTREERLAARLPGLTLGTVHCFTAKWDGNEWKHAPKVNQRRSFGSYGPFVTDIWRYPNIYERIIMNWPYKGFAANALWVFAAGVIYTFYYTTQGLGRLAKLWRGNNDRR